MLTFIESDAKRFNSALEAHAIASLTGFLKVTAI